MSATQTTMYGVFSVVEMFTIVTIVKTSTTIVAKNHNCCNSNHNCQNSEKNVTSLIIILDQIMMYYLTYSHYPLHHFSQLMVNFWRQIVPNFEKLSYQ